MRSSKVMLVSASAAAMILATLGASWAQQPPPGGPPVGGAQAGPPAAGGAPAGGLTQAGPPPGDGSPPTPLAFDEIVIQNGPASKGRGAPLPPTRDPVGADSRGKFMGRPGAGPNDPPPPEATLAAARDGASPAGVTALARDIFSSDDFYVDKDLWMNPLYYRCNSPFAIESIWGAYNGPLIGNDPPRTAAWGYCDRDTPRSEMVSPYPYRTAQAHYEALMAEAKSRGGPTQYSWDKPPPDWNGSYTPNDFAYSSLWVTPKIMQVPTYLSLLTPEYQQRFVQQMWHDAHNQIAWPTAYCMAPGFTRRWFFGGGRISMNPYQVEFKQGGNLGEPMTTTVNIGREFKMDGSVPYIGQQVRSLYGETIGFWDGDILVSWTSNVRGWLNHGNFEFSDDMQSVETWTPVTDKQGKFIGLFWDVVLYDPEALVDPVRIARFLRRQSLATEGDVFTQLDCVQTLFPIGDETQVPVDPGTTIQFTVPDIKRPWATIWEPFEKDMKAPENDVLAGFQ